MSNGIAQGINVTHRGEKNLTLSRPSRAHTRIYINLPYHEITLRRKDDSIYARNRLGPRVNTMISFTGYTYLRKSISAGKAGTSFAVETEHGGPEVYISLST